MICMLQSLSATFSLNEQHMIRLALRCPALRYVNSFPIRSRRRRGLTYFATVCAQKQNWSRKFDNKGTPTAKENQVQGAFRELKGNAAFEQRDEYDTGMYSDSGEGNEPRIFISGEVFFKKSTPKPSKQQVVEFEEDYDDNDDAEFGFNTKNSGRIIRDVDFKEKWEEEFEKQLKEESQEPQEEINLDVTPTVEWEEQIVGRHGQIGVRIYRPPLPAPSLDSIPIILYFPSHTPSSFTTSLKTPKSADATIISLPPQAHELSTILCASSSAIVITPGYIPKAPHPRFPKALHDALEVWDWVKNNYNIIPPLPASGVPNDKGRKAGIIGSGIGGCLASSIGLTEGREGGIAALGLWGGILDWTVESRIIWSISENKWIQEPRQPSEPTKSDHTPHTPLTITKTDFQKLRSLYVPNPTDWLDPFASPLFFLRTSGLELKTPIEQLPSAAQKFYYQQQQRKQQQQQKQQNKRITFKNYKKGLSTSSSSTTTDTTKPSTISPPPASRRTKITYPLPYHLLTLPKLRITTLTTPPFCPDSIDISSQGQEFFQAVVASWINSTKMNLGREGLVFDNKHFSSSVGEERAKLHTEHCVIGRGGKEWKDEVEGMAEWMKRKLEVDVESGGEGGVVDGESQAVSG